MASVVSLLRNDITTQPHVAGDEFFVGFSLEILDNETVTPENEIQKPAMLS